jgi:hypothetical protein
MSLDEQNGTGRTGTAQPPDEPDTFYRSSSVSDQYAHLSLEQLEIAIRKGFGELSDLLAKSCEAKARIGGLLIAYKRRRRAEGHKDWQKHVRECFRVSADTCEDYMLAYKYWPELAPIVAANPEIKLHAALAWLRRTRGPRPTKKARPLMAELRDKITDLDPFEELVLPIFEEISEECISASLLREHDDEDDEQEQGEKPEGEPSHVVMRHLYLNTTTLPPFEDCLWYLGDKLNTNNVTDTVVAACYKLRDILREQEFVWGGRPRFATVPATDWRKPVNRLEAFTRSYHWQRLTGDLDPTHAVRVIADALDLDEDGRVWFSLLFGHTYSAAMASILFQEFPDPLAIDPSSLESWTEAKRDKLLYSKACKYQLIPRPKLAAAVRGLQQWLAGRRPGDAFRELTAGGTEENFRSVYRAVKALPQFGRMTTWLAMQCLHDTLRLDIDHPELFIEDTDTRHVYNGLCHVYDRQDLCRGKHDPKPSPQTLALMQGHLAGLIRHMREVLPYRDIDIFRLESHLCEFGKWFSDPPREYPGLNSADINATYADFKRLWPDSDHQPFLKAQLTLHPSIRGLRPDKRLLRAFPDHGVIVNLRDLYPAEPDAYELLGVHREALKLPELFVDYHGDLEADADRHAPLRYEEFKPGEGEQWMQWAGLKP